MLKRRLTQRELIHSRVRDYFGPEVPNVVDREWSKKYQGEKYRVRRPTRRELDTSGLNPKPPSGYWAVVVRRFPRPMVRLFVSVPRRYSLSCLDAEDARIIFGEIARCLVLYPGDYPFGLGARIEQRLAEARRKGVRGNGR
jgi:hypothetical protein